MSYFLGGLAFLYIVSWGWLLAEILGSADRGLTTMCGEAPPISEHSVQRANTTTTDARRSAWIPLSKGALPSLESHSS